MSCVKVQIKQFFLLFIYLLSNHLCAQIKLTNSYRDSITNYQSNVGFNSITDGCPAPPKQPNYSIIGGGQNNGNFQYQGNIGYTPANNGFFRNTQFGLVVPTLDTGEGITDFEKSISSSWLQRWVCENNGAPTISTMISIQVPYDEPGEKTDIVTTFIITKNIGNGVGYFNLYSETTKGFTLDTAEYGVMLGYKMFLPKQKELLFGAMYQSGKILTFETSLEIDFSNGFTISPGINYAFNLNEGLRNVGGGLTVFYQSSKPIVGKSK